MNFAQLDFLKTGPYTHRIVPVELYIVPKIISRNVDVTTLLGKRSPEKPYLPRLCGLIPDLEIWDAIAGNGS